MTSETAPGDSLDGFEEPGEPGEPEEEGEEEEETPQESRSVSLLFLAVTILFLGSGLSSLIYQVIWLRMLSLIFGSTTFATASVLGVFMGGLALGSFLAGRYADRLQRPLLWYGILEAIIGIWALAVPLLFAAAEPLYAAAFQAFHLSVIPFSVLRLLMAALILIVPTACMGATLPLLARFVTTELSAVGRKVGTLYSFNTLGAVGGAMIAGFFLLPAIGLKATIFSAAALNFVLAGIVAVLSRRQETGKVLALTEAPEQKERAPLPWAIKAVLISFAISGSFAMIYEVGFTRALLMVIGSTTYAFSIMLSTFLIGLSLGSLWVARFVDRLSRPVVALAITQILTGIVAFGSLKVFNLLPWWNLQLASAWHANSDIGMLIRFLLSGLVMFPLTLCLGAAFPIVVRCCTSELDRVGRSVGTVYSVNTIGAIIGSLAAGFLLIPNFGTETALIVSCAGNALLAMFLLSTQQKTLKRSEKIAAWVVAFLAFFWAVKAPTVWDHTMLAHAQAERRKLSTDRALPYPDLYTLLKAIESSCKLLYYKDGASSTVAVLEYNIHGNLTHSLVTNGHVDGSDTADMPIQCMLTGYPLLMKPEAKSVCVVGWGCGVSTGVATRFPVQSITAVELEPSVVEGARYFHHVNHSPEHDPRVKLEFNDGRNFLMATQNKYDVIVSEPSNPWQAGVCNLFTREYFHICHERLNPGGVLSIWLQTVEVPPENIRGVLRSLTDEFKHVVAMRITSGNVILMASDQPLPIPVQATNYLLSKDPKVSTEMRKIGINSAADLIANLALDEESARKFAEGGVANVDDTNKLEYSVGKTYEEKEFLEQNLEGYRHARIKDSMLKQIDWGTLDNKQRSLVLDLAAANCLRLEDPEYAEQLINTALKESRDPLTLECYGQVQAHLGHPKEALAAWAEALKIDPTNREILVARARTSAYMGDMKQCRSDSEKLAALEKDPKEKAYMTALCEFRFGGKEATPEKILGILGKLPEDAEYVRKAPAVLYLVATQEARAHKIEQAEVHLRQYLILRPQDVDAVKLLGSLRMLRGDPAEASALWQYAAILGQRQYRRPLQDAFTLSQQGRNSEALSSLAKAVELWPSDSQSVSLLSKMAKTEPKAQTLLQKLQVLRPYLGFEPAFPHGAHQHRVLEIPKSGEAAKSGEAPLPAGH